jgi:hypothetical protein
MIMMSAQQQQQQQQQKRSAGWPQRTRSGQKADQAGGIF